MADVEKCSVQLEDLSMSQLYAKMGSSESACVAGCATSDDFLTVAASEQATTSRTAFVTAKIELSKSHWSERVEIDCNSTDDEIAKDNLNVFESLQMHSTWGEFFKTFGYDTEVRGRRGEMVVGEKFAEGGQAELFPADITWTSAWYNDYCEKVGVEWALKVFKKGTLLRQLQSQWPQEYLEWWANDIERSTHGFRPPIRWHCAVMTGTLMKDGRFAFLMVREKGDLRSEIEERMLKCGKDVGPFSKGKVEEIMYYIARGVHWLHKHGIAHRDIKASNVLVSPSGDYYIADYECSVGVVGTEFWRAPEILQACKEYTINQRGDLFTKASDVYSYGMTCYEVLTGKSPFQNEHVTILDVIKGKQPQIPDFVDPMYKDLLHWCWQLDPMARPSFDEILSLLEAHGKTLICKRMKLERMKGYEGGHALLGCTDPSHYLALLERSRTEAGGSYVCNLCLEMGNGEVYHCNSCGDFNLHLECARLPIQLVSFLHPHELTIMGPYVYEDNHICDGCLEDLEGSPWIYRCLTSGCDFDLHARCGKYAKSIFHSSHNDHKLLLIFNLVESNLDGSMSMCPSCKIGIRPEEFVYQCKECNFNIHPSCALDKLVGS